MIERTGGRMNNDGESAPVTSSDPIEKAPRQGTECGHGGSEHEQPVDAQPISLPRRTDFGRTRKKTITRAVFDAALERELHEVIQEAKKMARQTQQSSDLWECTGWFATINPDNLSLCVAPSVDPSKRLAVPGEYWRPRPKPRAQELKTRTHADPSCVSRIAAWP